jgi:hypothetical protein
MANRANLTGDKEDWPEGVGQHAARFRACVIAPALCAVAAPPVLALAMGVVLGPELGLSFRDLLLIGLMFTPALVLACVWQARLLTNGRPLHERALAGLSAVGGLVSALVALVATLLVVSIGLLIYVTMQFGLTPELILLWVFRILLGALLMFLMLSPSFMVAGTLLGLLTAVVVNVAYSKTACEGHIRENRGRALMLVVVLVAAAVIVFYTRFARLPLQRHSAGTTAQQQRAGIAAAMEAGFRVTVPRV